jgi:hypothetical protein
MIFNIPKRVVYSLVHEDGRCTHVICREATCLRSERIHPLSNVLCSNAVWYSLPLGMFVYVVLLIHLFPFLLVQSLYSPGYRLDGRRYQHCSISDFSTTCYMFRLYSVNNTNYFTSLLSLNISHIRLFCSVPCTLISVREIHIHCRVVLVRLLKFAPLFWVGSYRPTAPSVPTLVQCTEL